MISTDALQVGFPSVNEGSSLTIVNKTTSFIKTIVSFSIFHCRFHNVFQQNENVNIPTVVVITCLSRFLIQFIEHETKD